MRLSICHLVITYAKCLTGIIIGGRGERINTNLATEVSDQTVKK